MHLHFMSSLTNTACITNTLLNYLNIKLKSCGSGAWNSYFKLNGYRE